MFFLFDYRELELCCWQCGKCYPLEVSDPLNPKYIECDKCGGVVVTNSGKVMLKDKNSNKKIM